jgi:hypothetical protein
MGTHVGQQEGAREPRRQAHQAGDSIQFGIAESNFKSNLEFRTTLSLNLRTVHVRPPIWMFYIRMERKEIWFPTQPVSWLTKIGVVRNCQKGYFSELCWCCTTYFGPMTHVSSWSPLGTHPRVRP